ncbi:hypothetical protein GGF46_005328 [Coemansia sp. RSA 552]|nr:hypothetical protein GGF46_005328 [Coemansia sp. RSA 552]
MSSGSSVDCHFFLTGSCRNGDKCGFRHSEGARNTQETCVEFAHTAQCSQADCGKRHTEAPQRAKRPPGEVPCRNEEGGGVCTRSGCIFKHANPQSVAASGGSKGGGPAMGGGRGLNAGAQAFVPRLRPPRHPQLAGNMEWTPASATQSAGPKASKAPAPRPPMFENMEWTPNSAGRPAQPKMAAAPAPRPKVFGNMEWTPGMASKAPEPTHVPEAVPEATSTPAAPGSFAGFGPGPVASAFSGRTFGNLEWTPPAPAPAQAPTSTAESAKTIYDILGIPEEKPVLPPPRSIRQRRRSPVPVDRTESNSPVSRVCYASEFPEYAVGEYMAEGSTPMTDYSMESVDPTGFGESATEAVAETTAESTKTTVPAFHVPDVAVEALEDTGGTGIAEESPEPAALDKPIEPANNVDVTGPANPTTLKDQVALEDLEKELEDLDEELEDPAESAEPKQPAESAAPTPVLDGALGDGPDNKTQPEKKAETDKTQETKLPTMLTFQQIMERKRRKQADAAAVAHKETGTAQEAPAPGLRTPGKRQLEDDVEDDDSGVTSDGSEGKRAKREPPAKNYLALVERELEDLTAELSGPLENMSPQDKIAKAMLDDTYAGASISSL